MNYTRFFIASVVVLNILALVEMACYRAGKERGEIRYPWLFPLTVLLYAAVNAGTIVEYVSVPRPVRPGVVALGLCCIVVRFVLKYVSARTLGRYWGVHIEVRKDHPLITAGPYRLLRHPGYLSTVFEMAMLPLLAQAYYTLAGAAVGYGILLFARIRLEERALRAHWGDAYERYRRQTDALVPLRWLASLLKRRPRTYETAAYRA